MRKLNAGGGEQKSQGKLTFIRQGALESGQSISGVFLRTIKAGKFDANSTAYVIRLSESMNYDGQDLTAGTEVAVNSDALLRKYLPSVEQGTLIRLVYKGKADIKGGKTAHGWDIFADEPKAALP